MEFTDYLIWKFIAVVVLAFLYGLLSIAVLVLALNGRPVIKRVAASVPSDQRHPER